MSSPAAMPSCHQCGTPAPEQAQFCPACGLRLGVEPAPPTPPPPAWGGRRVVLWFLAAVVVLGALFLAGTIYFIRHTTIVSSSRSGGRVEAPFGVVSTGNDPVKVARALGVEVFPGAAGEKATQAELAAHTIAALLFRTQASPRQVIAYYHVRMPDATVRDRSGTYTLVQINLLDTLTVKASPARDASGGHTEIEITDIRH